LRTTVRINDALLEEAKREASRRGETLASLIEQGLRLVVAQSAAPHEKHRVVLPVSSETGGVMPGVDLNNNASLLDIM